MASSKNLTLTTGVCYHHNLLPVAGGPSVIRDASVATHVFTSTSVRSDFGTYNAIPTDYYQGNEPIISADIANDLGSGSTILTATLDFDWTMTVNDAAGGPTVPTTVLSYLWEANVHQLTPSVNHWRQPSIGMYNLAGMLYFSTTPGSGHHSGGFNATGIALLQSKLDAGSPVSFVVTTYDLRYTDLLDTTGADARQNIDFNNIVLNVTYQPPFSAIALGANF